MSQVYQILFEIDIYNATSPKRYTLPLHPYAGRRMGGARPRGAKTVKFKKKLKKWVG